MPRFKTPDYGLKMIPVDFDRQVIPGSFEHALCHLVDHEIDLSSLAARYRNDTTGAPAFCPAVLLKIVLLGYSRGLVSSRAIAAACRDNVLFMAVSGDGAAHFTTIAGFVAELGDEAAKLFARVLVICDRQGLIGRELFAIDGVKLPSNASKARSGTRADFAREADKMETAVKRMMSSHAAADASGTDPGAARATRTVERLKAEAAKLRAWLADHPDDRRSAKGKPRLSNRTDNESAKMATGKGVVQGYTGVAAVDARAQIVVDAQAQGTGSEQELLLPAIEASAPFRAAQTVICADAGYHCEANLKALAEAGVDAYICDNDYRSRDARYAGQGRHKTKPDPLWDKRKVTKTTRCFRPADFTLAADGSHCVCPAGKRLYSNGSNCTFNGYAAMKFRGAERDCVPCGLRDRCLRKPDTTRTRQVAFFLGKRESAPSYTGRMKCRIDSDRGKRRGSASRALPADRPARRRHRCANGRRGRTGRFRGRGDGRARARRCRGGAAGAARPEGSAGWCRWSWSGPGGIGECGADSTVVIPFGSRQDAPVKRIFLQSR